MEYGLEFDTEHLTGDTLEYYEMHLAQFVAFIDGTHPTSEVDEYFSKEAIVRSAAVAEDVLYFI
jgi:hypothetical protein